MTGSFVHLHLGIDATGLPADLESHCILIIPFLSFFSGLHSMQNSYSFLLIIVDTVINKWDPIDAEQNHVIISIPSVLDPALAPPNCHVIHAYAAANEVRK